MTTKTFKDICIEYATQLGKGLPLTPAEMCNAVIMYLNQAISDFEDEIGDPKYIAKLNVNNVFTQDNTFNLSADAHIFTVKNRLNLNPGEVYINNSNNCVQFQSKSGTLALTSDIPDLSTPASVEYAQVTGATITYSTDNAKELVIPIIAGDNVTIDADETNTHIVVGLSKNIPVLGDNNNLELNLPENYGGYGIGIRKVNNAQRLVITNSGLFYYLNGNFTALYRSGDIQQNFSIQLPNKSGVIACVDDIPDLDNYAENIDIVNGTTGNGIRVHDTTNTSPYTKYGYDKVETYGNSNTLQYTLNIPNKSGTIARMDDIPTPVTKYFTRVICNDTNTNTLYIFSCITEGDLSGNVYGDVVSLLTELGAINPTSALPCTGQTSTGKAVVGVYTDGSAITVFSGDSSTEEIPTSAEINVISK